MVCANDKHKRLMLSFVQIGHLPYNQKPQFTEGDKEDKKEFNSNMVAKYCKW